MPIRGTGIAAAKAAIAFHDKLQSLQQSAPPNSEKIAYYLKGIEGAVNRVRAALVNDDEEALADALLSVPGTARDLDAIDFNPAEFDPTRDLYREIIRRKAAFFLDLDPSLRH